MGATTLSFALWLLPISGHAQQRTEYSLTHVRITEVTIKATTTIVTRIPTTTTKQKIGPKVINLKTGPLSSPVFGLWATPPCHD